MITFFVGLGLIVFGWILPSTPTKVLSAIFHRTGVELQKRN